IALAVGIAVGIARPRTSHAEEPRYELRSVDTLHPEEAIEVEVALVLTGDPSEPGPGAWQVAMAHEGLSILSATSRGTDVDGYFHEGFEQTEITTGPGNAGFVSIVVLSFEDLVTLPPDGEFIIARAGYRATRNGCRDGARIEARDGLEGTGAPVRNVVSFNGTSVRPAVEALSWPACEPARFALEIDGDATKVVRPGAAGDDSEDAGGDDDLTIRARVVFRQDVPSARAFTLAIAHDPAKLELFEAAIAADGIASSIAEDGFA